MKIVVTGPYASGKSELIQYLTDGKAINISKRGTTVALDHGITQVQGIKTVLFGFPGLIRFRIIRKILAEGADGIIFVVDSSNKESDARARLLWREIGFFLPGLPCVVAANKQDIEGARDINEIRKDMSFLVGVPMIPTSATKGTNVRNLLGTLMYLIVMQWSTVFNAFAKYSGEPNGIEKLMKELKISEDKAVGYLKRFEIRRIIEVSLDNKSWTMPDELKDILTNPVSLMSGLPK